MLDSIQSLLDSFPESVVQVRGGVVTVSNERARQYLPQLIPGAPLPSCIVLPEQGESGTGSFTHDNVAYSYSCKSGPEGCVLSFRPSPPRAALKDWQLDRALQQLRSLLGEILAEVGTGVTLTGEVPAAFNKAFHRLFRLINNLEFMQQAAGEEEVPFRPVTMDLAGLCRDVVRSAGDLLHESGISLEYRSRESGLLIPGDPELLRRLLLGLISNAARAVGEGRISITLRRSRDWAVLVVSNLGASLTRQQLDALLQEDQVGRLPLPGQGAGLGLPIVRHITALHQGKLLVQGGDRPPCVLVSLPTGPLNGRSSVHTPAIQRDGGLDPVLTELSDILPASVFGLEGLD
ncbi:HAMP domain-containing sensor histidine kinase [Oscillospiraceae bacterium 50-58]